MGIHSKGLWILKWTLSYTSIGKRLLQLIPLDITKAYSYMAKWNAGIGFAIRLSEQAAVLELLEDTGGNSLIDASLLVKWRRKIKLFGLDQ